MNSELQSLFNNRNFKKDLAQIARLPQSVFDGIIQSFRTNGASGDAPFAPANVGKVVAATGQNQEVVAGAFSLSSFVATQIFSGETTPQEVIGLIEKELGDPKLAERLSTHILALQDVSVDVNAAVKRRQIVVRASRTLTDIEFSCSLRIGTKADDDQAVTDITKYTPEISELIPVVNLELSYRDAVQDGSSVFQLTSADVRRLIVTLQMAEKQVKAASAAVSLTKEAK